MCHQELIWGFLKGWVFKNFNELFLDEFGWFSKLSQITIKTLFLQKFLRRKFLKRLAKKKRF